MTVCRSMSPLPEDRAVAADEKMRVYLRMQQLRGEVREVLYLRILGEIMGRTENWARVTYFRGKKELQEDLT